MQEVKKLEQIKKNKGIKGFVAKTTDPNGPNREISRIPL